jgi:N6-adenosine-specific RNA methylase IME4
MEQAKLMLASCTDLDEIARLRDTAEVYRQFAIARGLGQDHMNLGCEIKLRADRRMGQVLKELVKNQGGRPGKTYNDPVSGFPTLKELGITHNESSRSQKIASLDDETFEEHISGIKEAGKELTTASVLRLEKHQRLKELRAKESETCTVADLQQVIDAGQAFGTIYADPPWQYGNQGTRAATDNHYPTMTVEEIAALPVKDLAAKEAHLHLWTTNAFLQDSFGILKAWGFEYKSVLVWVKPQMGLGNYWRVSHEFLLLGVRGNCPFLNQEQVSWIHKDRQEHSRKPEEVRKRIQLVSPGPRLELFGRRPINGWTVWGNEIEKIDFDADVNEFAVSVEMKPQQEGRVMERKPQDFKGYGAEREAWWLIDHGTA